MIHAGHDPAASEGLPNPPVSRASTILFSSLAELREAERDPRGRNFYGRFGTGVQRALGGLISELEGAAGTVLCSSGLQAITVSLLALLRAGDRVLIADCVYGPTRRFCESQMPRWGIEPAFLDPAAGADHPWLLDERTRLVLLESLGSLVYELQDLPAIAAAARRIGARVAIDSTWATPLRCQPLALGADLVIHSAS